MSDIRCPYCGDHAEFSETSESIYHGRDYGPVWICALCQAWCGCHKGTDRPLGRLANAELRTARIAAHAAFDPHWKTFGFSRMTAYQYLSDALEIDVDECHIGLFDAGMCRRVVAVCPLNIPTEKRHAGGTVRKV